MDLASHDVFFYVVVPHFYYHNFLLGFTDYPTLEAQKQRYLHGHFASSIDQVFSETMLTMFDRYIAPEELKRIAKLEIFDELEEWRMLMDHYSFTVAVHGEMLKGVLPTALS